VRLVLFDIDGTMLWSQGAGRRSMNAALLETIGSSGPPDYRYDGKTDPQIARDIMRHEGVPEARIGPLIAPLLERYVTLLEEELRERRLALFPGVVELVARLEGEGDAVVGLLTGNVRAGAELKLRAAGLDFARFRVGAFGSDHHERPALPAIAQRRAREMLGAEVRGEHVIVIGDTPADIQCGRGIGARAIAVATGHYGVDELATHDPAAVFATLADTDAVMAAIRDA
jgi:phosphoglycolate phosphatase